MFRPTPVPEWSRYVILVTSIGIIVCLLLKTTEDWREHRREAASSGRANDAA
jgi:hypothetical protein